MRVISNREGLVLKRGEAECEIRESKEPGVCVVSIRTVGIETVSESRSPYGVIRTLLNEGYKVWKEYVVS